MLLPRDMRERPNNKFHSFPYTQRRENECDDKNVFEWFDVNHVKMLNAFSKKKVVGAALEGTTKK